MQRYSNEWIQCDKGRKLKFYNAQEHVNCEKKNIRYIYEVNALIARKHTYISSYSFTDIYIIVTYIRTRTHTLT
jgi:hypothetical protein